MIYKVDSILQTDLSGGQYSADKNIRFNTLMLRSDLCDYSDAHIVAKGRISVTGINNANRRYEKASRILLHLGHAYQKSITHL